MKKTAIHHFSIVGLNVPGSIIENMCGGLSDEGTIDLYAASTEYREKMLSIMKKNEIVQNEMKKSKK